MRQSYKLFYFKTHEKKVKKRRRPRIHKAPNMPREAQRQSDRQAGPGGAGECGHHVDTLRHQPHEDAREAAMGTRVPTS